MAQPAEPEDTVAQIHTLTPAEARALFDRQARKLMGMSGDEFLRRYDAGEFDAILDDFDQHPEIMQLVMISSLGR